MPKSWREKLADDKDLPKVFPLTGKMSTRFGSGTMVIPAPREVDAIMKRIPKGKLITINEIRATLAKQHNVTTACPITSGIFAWIAAHAAHESASTGAKKITPYWRTLKSNGELNPKYPGGIPFLKKHLKSEGHKIISRGKRFFVENFDKNLAKLRP
jgi:6-O-methylguanine DNA methyltransferase, DNA binding domain